MISYSPSPVTFSVKVRVAKAFGAKVPSLTGSAPFAKPSWSRSSVGSVGTGLSESSWTPSILTFVVFVRVTFTVTSPGSTLPLSSTFSLSLLGVVTILIASAFTPTWIEAVSEPFTASPDSSSPVALTVSLAGPAFAPFTWNVKTRDPPEERENPLRPAGLEVTFAASLEETRPSPRLIDFTSPSTAVTFALTVSESPTPMFPEATDGVTETSSEACVGFRDPSQVPPTLFESVHVPDHLSPLIVPLTSAV